MNTHLSIVERSKLEILHRQCPSSRAIAKELGRHPSTICRDQERRKVSISNGVWSSELAASLEEKLQATWSPEQISERFRADSLPTVSFKTIYRWIYEGRLVRGELQLLRHKGKRQKPAETRGKFTIGLTISERPKEVRSRETFGHWELDTVVSGRGKSKGCIATVIERKTRLYTAILMPDRTALSMEIALGVATSQYPKGTFLTATADRGKEFACYANVETTHVCAFILPIRILPGNAVPTKMGMAYCESSTPRVQI